MLKIVVGGQLEKELIKNKIKEKLPNAQVEVKTDVQAASDIMSGSADYYFGACDTGGGGALAMAIALLGIGRCLTVTTQTNKLTSDIIKAKIDSGVKAFGFIPRDIDYVITTILPLIEK